MLSVVTFKWRPVEGYRSTFGPEAVNVLRAMVARNYRKRHRFICVTDDPAGLDSSIEVVPLWKDHAAIPSPHGGKNPSCYRRLKLFAPDAAKMFGPRFVSLDLDCVITADVAPLWDRPEDIVLWGDTARGTPYNGSMILQRAGSRSHVWTAFDPVRSPPMGRRLGYIGSDQAWYGVALGPNEPKWTARDGVFSFRNEIQPKRSPILPDGARIVFFHGKHDPWHADVKSCYPWVRDHWRA